MAYKVYELVSLFARKRTNKTHDRHTGAVAEMKGYARKNKRMQLNVKYRWRGMAKSNTRKQNKRRKFEVLEPNDALKEMQGTTFNPKDAPLWCNALSG